MSLFTKIRDEVESFFAGPVWNFIKPFIGTLESGGGALLVTAAETAVAAGFAATGTGEEKMAAALASFSAEVVTNGLPFVESQARALIEVALQKAKSSLPVAADPEVPVEAPVA